eukprot:GHVP01049381.1.p2 GENE.GHVP01049381.1~~GHVP01049381.1.p2  ORF type:complete len:106 (+),score=3.97 GHVP01049381.1:814-1131(+)
MSCKYSFLKLGGHGNSLTEASGSPLFRSFGGSCSGLCIGVGPQTPYRIGMSELVNFSLIDKALKQQHYGCIKNVPSLWLNGIPQRCGKEFLKFWAKIASKWSFFA